MTIHFITGNKHKISEAKHALGENSFETINLDLDEIQSMDPQEIITHKINQAIKQNPDKKLFCGDVSFELECLNNFPGPLIKWFEKTLGPKKIAELVHKHNNHRANVKCTIGYFDKNKIHFFIGKISGTIIPEPKGTNGFGFDSIFIRDGQTNTFAQMSEEEKSKLSHRGEALKLFKKYLISVGELS